MSEQDLDFAAAMQALGVRPIAEESGAGRTKKKRSSKATTARGKRPPNSTAAAPRRQVSAPDLRQAQVSGVGRRSPPPRAKAPAPPVPRASPTAAVPPSAPAGPSLVEKRLKAQLEAVQAELASARAEADEAAARTHAVQAELGGVRKRLLRMETADQERQERGPASLRQHLESRGALGESEALQLLRALIEAGRGTEILDRVVPAQPADFAEWLDDHTAILGDCGACPAVGNRAVLRVPMARCEVCKGSDIRRAGRRLVDACLNNGVTRITVVGGSPKYHRQLRELITHHRLKLRMVPGRSRRTRKQARDDLRGSDLVAIWGPTYLSHSTSDLYTAQADQGQLLLVPHRGITTMLEVLAARVEALQT